MINQRAVIRFQRLVLLAMMAAVTACGSATDDVRQNQSSPTSAAVDGVKATATSRTNTRDGTSTGLMSSPNPTAHGADVQGGPTPTTPPASWGNHEIYIVDADGSGERNLTNDIVADMEPAWSPDGTRIAFTKSYPDQRGGALYAMSADAGSNVVEVLPASPGGYREVTWLPDERIAYVTWHGGNDGGGLYIAEEGGANEIKVPTSGSFEHVAWSADASRIAYVGRDGGNSDIYVMNVDGSGIHNLINSTSEESHPSWSPDGKSIVYSRTDPESYTSHLYVLDVETGEQRALYTDADAAFSPAWSPDGSRIAFSVGAGHEVDLWVIDASGKHPRQITSAPHADLWPRWSPDSSTIAFVSDRDGGQPIPCSYSAMASIASVESMDDLAWLAHTIVVGTVIETLPPVFGQALNPEIEQERPIYTDYVVQVERQFRGFPAETIHLRTNGGTIGDCTQTYEPEVSLAEGGRYLFFLYPALPDRNLPDAFQPSVVGTWIVNPDDTISSPENSYNPGGYDGMTLDEVQKLVVSVLSARLPSDTWDTVPLEEAPITQDE